jgi:hypothetical protein
MTITSNRLFDQLYRQYGLETKQILAVKIPIGLQNIFNKRIFIKSNKILIPSLGEIFTIMNKSRNLSDVEDFNNHFHVSGYAKPKTNKMTFMLAIRVIQFLAEKFEKRKIKGIRFWMSFETKEISEAWAKANNLHERGDKHYINDRLSFYKRRKDEYIIDVDSRHEQTAILIIDI